MKINYYGIDYLAHKQGVSLTHQWSTDSNNPNNPNNRTANDKSKMAEIDPTTDVHNKTLFDSLGGVGAGRSRPALKTMKSVALEDMI